MRFTTQHLVAASCALGAYGVAAVPVTNKAEGTRECHKTKVAILGAGVTGITAAQALANAVCYPQEQAYCASIQSSEPALTTPKRVSTDLSKL